jgi:hypothetical protein
MNPAASAPNPDATPDGTLQRRLGAVDGAALVVANVVGAGIFLTPGIIAGMVPAPQERKADQIKIGARPPRPPFHPGSVPPPRSRARGGRLRLEPCRIFRGSSVPR